LVVVPVTFTVTPEHGFEGAGSDPLLLQEE
jgi:hypothetical protein